MRAIAAEFINFTGMRCITLLVEFWGVCVLVNDMHIADFTGKLLIQVVVVVLNYMISKCYVFKEEAV